MEVNFSPEVEAKLNDLAARSGKAAVELVEDAVAGYVDEFADVREMLQSRYDDVINGRVEVIDGEEAFRRLRQMMADGSSEV